MSTNGKRRKPENCVIEKKKKSKIVVVHCVLAAMANNKYHVVNQRFE